MATVVLGLDIGGANLKAATADKRAVSVPFALWKQPDKLPAALAELVARFPEAEELAVTMTGELCDCFETKRHGVNAILTAVQNVSRSRPIRVWSTDGEFVDVEQARQNHLKVAAANWHALATFAGRYAPTGTAILVDVGSTTTDIIPLQSGFPYCLGMTDRDRLRSNTLVYAGVKRTPICALAGSGLGVAAELFATTRDVYTVLGQVAPDAQDNDTADGRPATVAYSLARLARMTGGDRETTTGDELRAFARACHATLLDQLLEAAYWVCTEAGFEEIETLIVSGAGEFLARNVVTGLTRSRRIGGVVSLNDELGPEVSACAPAYAVAVLATERN